MDRRDFVRRRRSQSDGSSVNILVTTLAGAWAGVISWVCVIPFDVVKTLMQADEKLYAESVPAETGQTYFPMCNSRCKTLLGPNNCILQITSSGKFEKSNSLEYENGKTV